MEDNRALPIWGGNFVKHAWGGYVAFTDADCISQKSWFKNLVRELDNSILGVGVRIKNVVKNSGRCIIF